MEEKTINQISPKATLGQGVSVGAFACIEEDVVIGAGTTIGSNAVILRGTRIGENCKIFPGAVIGAEPQDLKFAGEYTTLEIGDNTTIREFCTINRGTTASGKTVVGSNCLLMAYVHVAHDCIVGNNVILANNVNLAGHVEVGDHAILGGLVAVHQFVRIGAHVMVGGGSLVRKDVPPFVKAAREPLSYIGVNSIGLTRRGFSQGTIDEIQEMYRCVFLKSISISKSLENIEHDFKHSAEKDIIVSFIKNSERGLMKGFSSTME